MDWTEEACGSGAPEIITLQLGNYSNFVGAHFFNLQDPQLNEANVNEFDPHILWRETRGFGNTRHLSPRVLIVDLKENLTRTPLPQSSHEAAMSKSALDKKTNEAQSLWQGKIERIFTDGDNDSGQSSSSSPNSSNAPLLQDAKKVKRFDDRADCTWRDYARWTSDSSYRFAIPNFAHNQEKGVLSTFSQGLEIWKDMEEDIWDGVRKYAEECDHLQGFHLLVDEDDGFAGIAAGILQNLSDEYERKSTLCLGLSPPLPVSVTEDGDKKGHRRRLSNTALLWNAFNHHSSAFSSLSLCDDICSPNATMRSIPFLNYSPSSYSSSSVIAATLDTLASSYRVRNSIAGLSELVSFLSGYGRKMGCFGASIPFPLNRRRSTFFKTLQNEGLDSLRCLTPGVNPEIEKSTGNYFVVRGIPDNHVISDEEMKMLRGGPQIRNSETCFEIYSRDSFPRSVNIVRPVSTPVRICYPFPSIMDNSVVEQYNVGKNFLAGNPETLWQLPTISTAHNTSETGNLIESLIGACGGGRNRSNKITEDFVSSDLNMEFDDYIQCLDELNNLRDSYKVSSD